MARPIKERGIRWTETYGDKSAYLKEEMEKQIGPGGYFRWEGHDSTTGNDYYVVVSPGYSPKRGYHFFAGLRKMPADHGASGKEFATMGEAINYAYEMWHVPKPDSMPQGWRGYNRDDIANKEIVLKGVHASSDREVRVSRLIIQPELGSDEQEKLGMSVQTMRSQFDPRVGPRVLPEQYCFAYAASPVTGFLPALYSRMRFTGVDGQNFDPRGTGGVVNLMGDGPIPGSKDHRPEERPPLMATCQEPDEASFNDHYAESLIDERLYEMPEKFSELPTSKGKEWWKDLGKYRNAPNLYPEKFKAPYGDDEDPNVRNYRWGNMDVKMRVKVPAKTINEGLMREWNARFLRAYKDSVRQEAAEAARVEGHPDALILAQRASEAEGLTEVLKDMTGGKKGKAKGSQVAGNLSGRTYEVILKARDVGLYDQFVAGLKQHIQDTVGSKHHVRDHPIGRTGFNFMRLYRRAQEIMGTGDEELKQRYGLDNGFDFNQVYYQKIRVQGSQTAVYDENGMPIALAPNEQTGKQWRQEEKSKKIRTRYVFKDPVGIVERAVPGFAAARKEGDEVKALEFLSKFHQLASQNKVQITAQDVFDARTVGPLLTNPKTAIPKTDDYRLPADMENSGLPADQVSKMSDFNFDKEGDMVSPYYVEATRDRRTNEHGQQEDVFAARYFDPKVGKFVYGPIPVDTKLDVEGRQQFNGIPTTTPNARTMIVDPEGSPYVINRNEFQLYDMDSCGKFIPGDYYDISLGPKGVSSMGWHREGVSIPDGFDLRERAHKASWDQSKGLYVSRQQSSDPFTKGLIEAEGQDPDDYAIENANGKYTYTDNYPLMLYIKDKLKLPNRITEPFTRMTMMDLKVIAETEQQGKDFFAENEGRFGQYADASQVPEQEHADYEKYVYGKTVSECKGETVPQEVFKTLGNELSDPENALRPKQGAVWALWATPPEGAPPDEAPDWVKIAHHGILFAASEQAAELDKGMVGVKGLIEAGWAVEARQYVRDDNTSYAMPSLNNAETPGMGMVHGANKFIEYATGRFPTDAAEPEVDSPLPEEEELQLPEEPEIELELPEEFMVPEEPELELPEEFMVPEERVPEEAPPQAPPGRELVPERQQMPPAQPPAPEAPQRGVRPAPAPQPKRWPSLRPEDYLASTEKLLRMAERLDGQGRYKEADAVDRAIKKIAGRMGENA